MRKLTLTLAMICGTFAATQAQTYIQGVVTPVSAQNGQNDMTVWLIEKCVSGNSYTLTAIDSQQVADSAHIYSFVMPQVGSGCQLLVKAAFTPNSSHYANYLPTYYAGTGTAGSLLWSGATAITAAGSNYNFTMVAGTNPGGPGFVGGSVLVGANKGTAIGDPIEGRILLLTDMNDNAVAYTYTDALGEFSFSGLANGTYKLFGDQWGKSNPVLYVTVDANNQNINNIVFEENDTKFEGHFVWATNVTNVNSNLSQVSVYPNPVQGQINVEGLNSIKGAKTITVTSVTGAVIFNQTFNEGQAVSIAADNLSAGLYMLDVKTTEGNKTFKLVK